MTLRPARKALAPRWLVVTHRYVGVVMGLLMLAWFLSGMVMLFVHWPEVTERERVVGLAPIEWAGCCDFGDELADALPIEAAEIEAVAGTPVLRLKLPGGEQGTLDLTTGEGVREFGPDRAAVVASAYVRGRADIRSVTAVDRDQWTVTGYFNDARPFWRVRLMDGTDVWVSWSTGKVAQAATMETRLLNWLGPIPHWLYPAILRQDVKLWTQVVVWTSVVGTFLTLTGLWLGLVAWRPWGDRRLSPYRGLMTWHHLTGLAAGVLTLTWVVSGLMSMNPWGLLESGPDATAETLQGPPPTWGQVKPALAAAAARRPQARQLRLARFQGRVFVMADGQRLDAQGRPAPLTAAQLAAAGAALGPVASQELITRGDAYLYSHHDPAPLPAWRVVRADGTRHYLDPRSGEPVATFDAGARGFRWWHLALHRLDFVPGLDRGPAWAAIMLLLLGGCTVGVATGVWLGVRRIRHDVTAPFRRPRRERAAP